MAQKKNETPDDEPVEETDAADAEAAEAEAESEDAEAPDSDERTEDDGAPTYEELQAQSAEFKDQLLRALAETENTRRRAERERQDASKYAIAAFAREVLSVADNLARALDAVPAKARDGDDAVKNLVLGIEMTQKEMAAALEKAGVKPVEALDKPFDPNFHQAMFELDDAEKPAGTVVQEMQKGYTIHDRLLRPAMVAVSKGGGKPASTEGLPEEAPAPAQAEEPAEKSGEASTAYGKPNEPAGSKLDKEL